MLTKSIYTSLKYQKFTQSGCRKFDLVAKTQWLCKIKKYFYTNQVIKK